MTFTRGEETRRSVVLAISTALLSAARSPLAKRVQSVMGSDEREVLKTLSLIEREPGLSVACFRLIATGKKIIQGDVSLSKAFDELHQYIIGAEPQLPSLLKDPNAPN